MAEDTIMFEQAMDIDNNVPPAPFTYRIPAVAPPRSQLCARRSLPNRFENRGALNSLRRRPGAKVQKTSSNPIANHNDYKAYRHGAQRRQMTSAHRNRKLRIQRAIADGSFQIRAPGDGDPEAVGQNGQPQQIERLNKHIVTQALYSPLPGMAFDPALPSLSEAETGDLVQALEAFQVHLARKGNVVLSSRAGSLLRGFARDVLSMALLQPHQPGCQAGVDDFWSRVAVDYQRSKRVRWLTLRVTKLLQSTEVNTAAKWGNRASFATHVKVVIEALEAPGKHPLIDEAIAGASKETPPCIVAQPSTLRALMAHFEAGRSRYLANLNTSSPHGPDSRDNTIARKPTQGFGMLPRNNGHEDLYDSSDDEDDGVPGLGYGGGVEDNGQVEEGVPSGHTQWFLVKMDKWMALKNGLQQQGEGGVDVDMFSGLDLGDSKWGS